MCLQQQEEVAWAGGPLTSVACCRHLTAQARALGRGYITPSAPAAVDARREQAPACAVSR